MVALPLIALAIWLERPSQQPEMLPEAPAGG
jgi:hypothetical protein